MDRVVDVDEGIVAGRADEGRAVGQRDGAAAGKRRGAADAKRGIVGKRVGRNHRQVSGIGDGTRKGEGGVAAVRDEFAGIRHVVQGNTGKTAGLDFAGPIRAHERVADARVPVQIDRAAVGRGDRGGRKVRVFIDKDGRAAVRLDRALRIGQESVFQLESAKIARLEQAGVLHRGPDVERLTSHIGIDRAVGSVVQTGTG